MPGKVGGKRKGAGRPPGSTTRATTEALKKAAATGELPLEYMLRVMRDEKAQTPRRDDMAKAAAPFLHRKLASITHTGANGGPIRTIDEAALAKLTDKELDALLAVEHKLAGLLAASSGAIET